MTTEQRLAALEAAVFKTEVPTNDRQKNYVLTGKDGTGRILVVRRLTDGEYFGIGTSVRHESRDYAIYQFDETVDCLYVTLKGDHMDYKTVPLCDLIPLTTGGASHDWVGKHGVKEWEITAFRSTRLHDSGAGMQHNVNSNTVLKVWLTGDCSVKTGHCEIYEVRRLSDGTIWKLGDEVVNDTGGIGKITGFRITDGAMMVNSDVYFAWSFLNRLKRPRGKEWNIIKIKGISTGWIYTWNGHQFAGPQKSFLSGDFSDVADIYCVHRVADNTKWTIGDEVATPQDGTHVIGSFKIMGNVMCAVFSIGEIQLEYLRQPSGKEWEIVEFRKIGADWGWILKDGRYGLERWTLDQLMNEDEFSVKGGGVYIHSVRRIHDGQLFTIGDKIDYPNKQHSPGGCTICHFTIFDGEIFVNNHHNGTPHTRIKDWIKWEKRKPIFTTADGVPVYEGDTIYWTMRRLGSGLTGEINVAPITKEVFYGCYPDGYSTRKAAQAAIDNAIKKPLFVTADGVPIYLGMTFWYQFVMNGILTGGVESRIINEMDNDMLLGHSPEFHAENSHRCFSTRAAAEAAYNEWLYQQPVLTLANVMNPELYSEDWVKLVKEKLAKKC